MVCTITDQFPAYDAARDFLKILREEFPICADCVTLLNSGQAATHLICTSSDDKRHKRYREAEMSAEVNRLVEFQTRLRHDPVFYKRFLGAMN